jgi:hypothetical protein
MDQLVLVATIPGRAAQPPHAPGHHLPVRRRALPDQQAKAAAIPEQRTRTRDQARPAEIAERLAAAKLASPQSETAWRAQVAAGMLFNPLGRQRDIASFLTDPAASARQATWYGRRAS